jgi:hypothetical protein
VKEQKAPDWIEIALEEFKARRETVLALLNTTQTTLAFGATTVGILIAGSLNVWEDRLVASVAFLVAIPLVCVVVLANWAGLVLGMMALSVYLVDLEKTLRGAYRDVPDTVFVWQAPWTAGFVLRPPRMKWWIPDFRWLAGIGPAIFVLLAGGSIILGAYRGYDGNEVLITVVAVTEGFVLVVVSFLVVRGLATASKHFRAKSEAPEAGGEG